MENFIWETHGIHTGTGSDHVKHGIDDIENVVKTAIQMGHPSVTFIIHTPRLTGYRYTAEINTDIKFIRGDVAYFNYGKNINRLKAKYKDQIKIIHGIELEWHGSGIGLAWNRSKIFQADGIDFVIGSVHFSREKIAYDGSKKETQELLDLRGNLENYWVGYLEEMIEMIDETWETIQVVGHIDLPKLYVPFPDCFKELDTSDELPAKKMRLLLEKISEHHLALDVNLAGIYKNCGIYPEINILKRAKSLGIPVTLGTDCHHINHLGKHYTEGIEYLKEAGYKHYLSFSNFIPMKRPLFYSREKVEMYSMLNTAIEILNRRSNSLKNQLPNYSFGGVYSPLCDDFDGSVKNGSLDTITVRKGVKSLTISPVHPKVDNKPVLGIYSSHRDQPGMLTSLLNSLASEGININTAELNSNGNGVAEAFLTFTGDIENVKEALEFTKGTNQGNFYTLELREMEGITEKSKGELFLVELDGIEIHTPISKNMIITSHNNSSGVLLILMSALSSIDVNVETLQLGQRGNRGYAVIGIDGDNQKIESLLNRLGPHYNEVSHLILNI